MTKEMLSNRSCWWILCAVLALIFVGPTSALCANQPWTTVASAGTVDEGDLDEVSLSGGYATVSAAAPSTVMIRYNVVAMDDLFERCLKMAVRFRDNGALSQVIVRLKRLNLLTGFTATLLTLDSNTFGPNAAYQLQAVGSCDLTLDFGVNAYFIEAELKKTGANGNPGLAAIKVYSNP